MENSEAEAAGVEEGREEESKTDDFFKIDLRGVERTHGEEE